MSVRVAFFLAFAALIALLAGLILVMSQLLANQGRVAAAEQRRYQAFSAADRLQENANHLSGMARGFAATGDPKFERFFYAILDIHEGRRARPDDYADFAFWSRALRSGEIPEAAEAAPEAMDETLERIRLVEVEEAALQTARQALQRLTDLNVAAMNAVKNRADGKPAGARPGGRDAPSALLYGDAHQQASERLMSAIDDFVQLVSSRVSEDVERLRQRVRSQALLAMLLSLVIVVVSVVSFFLLNRKVCVPVRKLMLGAQAIQAGELDVAIDSPARDELGELARAFTAMTRTLADERGALEREIAEREVSEAQLRGAVEGMSDGIAVTDREGRVVLFNRQTVEILEYPDDLYYDGITIEEVARFHIARGDFGGGDPDLLLREYMKEIDAGLDATYERRLESGRIVEIRRNALPGGGFVFIYTDITARKNYQNALERARDAAETANRAKSQFLSNMSHELRTPLNGVLGYCQILLRDQALSAAQKDSLSAIESCGQHLLTLINDVLDLSKIESGELEISPAACDLHRLARGAVDIVAQRARSKGLDLTFEIDADVPRAVRLDDVKLKQILVNLLGNAVKFTERGRVGLAVACDRPGRLVFTVSDTGKGIPAHELKVIFNPFVQAAEGKAAGGTGLGLAISRRLAEAMGGGIEVQSQVDEGSRFTVTVTCEPAAIDEVAAEDGASMLGQTLPRLPPGQSATVLIADDRSTNRDVLVNLLGSAGFETVTADNGLTALEVLRKERVSLALMDIRMPVMDGLEATRSIKANPQLRSIPVIAVTASVFPEMRAELLAAGCDDFIAKPIQVEEVFCKLQKHLGLSWLEQQPASAEVAEASEAATPAATAAGGAELGELLARLIDAAELGDLSALRALTEELAGLGDGGAALAERIEDLRRAFDFAAIKRLAEERRTESMT